MYLTYFYLRMSSIYLKLYYKCKIKKSNLYLGWTSLMYAARNGRTNVMKILLKNGANINAEDYYG